MLGLTAGVTALPPVARVKHLFWHPEGDWHDGGQGGRCVSDHDDINLERNKLGCENVVPLGLPLDISVFDQEVATLDVTEVTQSLKGRPLAMGMDRPCPHRDTRSGTPYPGHLSRGLGRSRSAPRLGTTGGSPADMRTGPSDQALFRRAKTVFSSRQLWQIL